MSFQLQLLSDHHPLLPFSFSINTVQTFPHHRRSQLRRPNPPLKRKLIFSDSSIITTGESDQTRENSGEEVETPPSPSSSPPSSKSCSIHRDLLFSLMPTRTFIVLSPAVASLRLRRCCIYVVSYLFCLGSFLQRN